MGGNFFQWLVSKNDPVFRAIEEAIDLLGEQDYDGALEVLHGRALRRAPGDRRALLHVGVAHMLKGELDVAENFLLPIAKEPNRMDSETAAAELALERIAVLRKERE